MNIHYQRLELDQKLAELADLARELHNAKIEYESEDSEVTDDAMDEIRLAFERCLEAFTMLEAIR